MPEATDVDLTPSENLFIEVLAGRYRTGESVWTFGKCYTRTAKSLAAKKLIGFKGGIIENTIRAWLTDEGKKVALDETYTPPTPPPLTPEAGDLTVRDLRRRVTLPDGRTGHIARIEHGEFGGVARTAVALDDEDALVTLRPDTKLTFVA